MVKVIIRRNRITLCPLFLSGFRFLDISRVEFHQFPPPELLILHHIGSQTLFREKIRDAFTVLVDFAGGLLPWPFGLVH